MKNNICELCPLRLYNVKGHNISGIGNALYGNCIVIPNVDYPAYKEQDMSFSNQVKIITDILSSTGELDNVYIVPLIRCNENISCQVNNDVINRCLSHFIDDIKQYNFNKILLLGNAARRFLNCDITDNLNIMFVSNNRRCYGVNYSPLIKYTNEEKFNVFKDKLIHWYNCVINNKFSGYIFKRI